MRIFKSATKAYVACVLLTLVGCGSSDSGLSQTNALSQGLQQHNDLHQKTLQSLPTGVSGTSSSEITPKQSFPFTASLNFSRVTRGYTFAELSTGAFNLDSDQLGIGQTQLWPAIQRTFSAPNPTINSAFYIDGTHGAFVEDGSVTRLTNDQTSDSFSLESLSTRPSGANIVFTSDTSSSSSRSYSGVATFPSGWSAVFTRSDITIDYPNTGGTQTTYKTISFAQPVVSPNRIVVANLRSTHDLTSNQAATNTSLDFDISTVNSTVRGWSVEIEKDGSVIRTLTPVSPGPGTVTGSNPLHVTASWDGLDAANRTVTGNYTWVATANTTLFIPSGNRNDGVNSSQVRLNDNNEPATLQILDGASPLATVLANSNDKTLLLTNPNDQSVAGVDAKARLSTVYPAGGRKGTSEAGNTWHLKASKLRFSGSTPVTVKVLLEGDFSHKQLEVALTNPDPQNSQVWEGDVNILAQGLLLPQDQLSLNGQPIRTTYTVSAAADLDQLANLLILLEDLLGLENYPLPRLNLGALADPIQIEGNHTNDSWALNTPDNVRCFGFEPVQIKIDPSRNSGLVSPVQATLKTRNPASVGLFSVHGDHDGGKLAFGGGVLDPSLDLRGQDTASLKTLMLLSCNVLDLHDYNNNLSDSLGRTGPFDPVSMRPSPGILWRNATGRGRTILLGYNYPFWSDTGVDARKRYFNTVLKDLENRGVESGIRQQLAWLRANYEAAVESQEQDSSCLNACAWDQNYYYFISFSPPYSPTEREKRNAVHVVNGFYRIRLDSLGDNSTVDPTVSPPKGLGVEQIEISGPPCQDGV